MANIEIKNPPEYHSEVRKFETTDLGHADILNKPLGIMINNEEFLKKLRKRLEVLEDSEIIRTDNKKGRRPYRKRYDTCYDRRKAKLE